MKGKMHKILRDGLLGILTFVLIVSVYISIDRAGSRSRDWRAGPICGVLHGHVDFFSPPIMTVNLGSYREVMFFKHSTVVRSGGTYLVFGMNRALLFGSVAVLGALIRILLVFGLMKSRARLTLREKCS
jgi:hypothetical protein